jgi:hypothetical protein
MRPDPAAVTAPRPPTLKQLEARAARAQAARIAAWEKVSKARMSLAQALDVFHDALGHETAAFRALCAAGQGRPAEVAAPPAPETLTAADEED